LRGKSVIEKLVNQLLPRPVFLPFRIRLLSGDLHNIAAPELAVQVIGGLYIIQRDGHWVQFPYESVASVESLIVDDE